MRCRILAVLIVLGGPPLLPGQGDRAATGPMAKETLSTLRSAATAASTGKAREENLSALDRLAKTPWRRVDGLPWVHVFPSGEKQGRFTAAWKVAEDDRAYTLLAADLVEVTLERGQVDRVEAADFRADLRSFPAFRERDPGDKQEWDFAYIPGLRDLRDRSDLGVLLLRLAHAAADRGFAEEADAILAELLGHTREGLGSLYDDIAWQVFRPAMFRFREGGPREGFLDTCKGLLASYPGSRYDDQLRSLIAPMEREASAPRPTYLDAKPADRAPEETICAGVFELRNLAAYQLFDPGYPLLFALPGREPSAADRLVEIGPAAIPYLIEALGDDTPTRTIAWQRSFYPIHFVLRRRDVALKCLERIAGCPFYWEGATFVHFHIDKPERQASVLADIRAWWGQCAGAPQARMVRAQLALMPGNITLRPHHRIAALNTLEMLEGPEGVVAELHRMLAEEPPSLNSPIRSALDRIDPQAPIREAFRRFREGTSRDGDYRYLYKYGDKAVYAEIARRFEATGKLDPGSWTVGDQVSWAGRLGKNWSIPIAAGLLKETEMTGARGVGRGPVQPFSVADMAIEEFQRLIGKDFGYDKAGDVRARLAAIAEARRWWDEEGREALKGRIAEDHPPVEDPGDLFLTDAEIDRRVAAIEGGDPDARRQTVASLGKGSSYKVQRALLDASGREADPETLLAMLGALERHPEPWHLPTLTRLLDRGRDIPVRVRAGQMIRRLMGGHGDRLETRDAALAVARRLAGDEATPTEVRRASVDILKAQDPSVGLPPR